MTARSDPTHLDLVPDWFRTRWPLKRFFWQQDEIEAAWVRADALKRALCEHEWEYLEREPGETYTGYCERCTRCGEIVQIPQ